MGLGELPEFIPSSSKVLVQLASEVGAVFEADPLTCGPLTDANSRWLVSQLN